MCGGKIEFGERKTGSQKSGLQLGVFKVPQTVFSPCSVIKAELHLLLNSILG